jgi:phosphatidylserine/phosphatidylglycerophosphate/cardiolipin synthase-like enzyme
LVVVLAGCGSAPPAAPHPSPATGAPPSPSISHSTRPAPTTTAAPGAVHATTSPVTSLVVEPDDTMQPLYALMSGASRTLDMTMYELADPTTVSILEQDAGRGVQVRVLLDRDYSGASVNAGAYSELGAHGVAVRWAYSGSIFHQKSVTVDGARSAIMTLNLTSRYYSSTRDFAVITDDGAEVAAIESVFDQDWTGTKPATPPASAGLLWSPGATDPLVNLVDSARRSLLVENEEMDDPSIETALEQAARRGVEVDVVMTYSSEWAPALGQLAASGVHVRTYASDASIYIHAKAIVVDSGTAFLGSQNFSRSSLERNRELGLLTTDGSLIAGVAGVVGKDFAGAREYAAR